jgi:hypothetical protein
MAPSWPVAIVFRLAWQLVLADGSSVGLTDVCERQVNAGSSPSPNSVFFTAFPLKVINHPLAGKGVESCSQSQEVGMITETFLPLPKLPGMSGLSATTPMALFIWQLQGPLLKSVGEVPTREVRSRSSQPWMERGKIFEVGG